MIEAIDTLSTSAPPAATVADGDTPLFAAFRRWADTVYWCECSPWTTDAANDWRANQITRCEREMAKLAPIDARDVACLAWVALHVAAGSPTRSQPCAIDCNSSLVTPLFVGGIKALHPDIAAIITAHYAPRASL